MTMYQLKSGQSATVKQIALVGESRIKINQMGLTAGTRFEIVKRAPLGDPIEISLRGYRLCLRGKDAKNIIVEDVE